MKFLSDDDSADSVAEKEALDQAVSKGKELTDHIQDGRAGEGMSLVDRWIELARENEREPGQIDRLLQDLGTIPPPEAPSDRAFWVGALINPIPAMGVALEVRPALLTADTAMERVDLALDGIEKSIRHMDGTARMW